MIQDARALRPTWTPNDLCHREGAIDHLSTCLQPIHRGQSGEDVLITGPSGAGKTTLARYITQELERQTLNVTTGIVDCTSDSTTTEVLHTLVRDLNSNHSIPRPAASSAQLLDAIANTDGQLVIVIDEVDQLDDRTLLSSLYKIPHVTLLLICIDGDTLLANAHPGVQSRIRTAHSVSLDRYTRAELSDIVAARAEIGLTPGAVSRPTTEEIAELAAGNAHYALALLRRAARQASADGRTALPPGLVSAVATDATADIHDRVVDQLSTHHRLLYDIIRDAGEIAASDLHDTYQACAQQPRARSSRRRYLHVLEKYDLIEKTGATKDVRYQHLDPTASRHARHSPGT